MLRIIYYIQSIPKGQVHVEYEMLMHVLLFFTTDNRFNIYTLSTCRYLPSVRIVS